jgi:3-deoxy-7-phosphoheptulonate synthase
LKRTSDLHIVDVVRLVSPVDLKARLPMTEAVGPCSIHEYGAALEYAGRIGTLAKEVGDRFYILMRAYFEKPRTALGWRGLIIDPRMDGSHDIAEGLYLARKLLLEITALGVPAATELLDPIVPQYVADLISWAAIGARTTESQTHRDMASGLSMPIGFKNNTDGNLQIAIDAMSSAKQPHSFLGIDQTGQTCILKTSGNPHTHIILRGSRLGENYRLSARQLSQEPQTAGRCAE